VKNRIFSIMEGFSTKGRMKDVDSKFKQEIYSRVIRAGKRTYFFDVKSTRNDEYYLTITESIKQVENNGKIVYEKHKIFLYNEDFEKFMNCLEDVIDYIDTKQPYETYEHEESEEINEEAIAEVVGEEVSNADFTNIKFEDLNS
jgi:hypothetical protein